MPPNERRGRVHSSSITVAVLEVQRDAKGVCRDEVEFSYTKDSGAGGQNRNKRETAVVAKHTPTGITVRICTERSQEQNKHLAMEVLSARILDARTSALNHETNSERRRQIGSGMRGDKVRTVRVQDGMVKCEVTGNKKPLAQYEAGDIWFS